MINIKNHKTATTLTTAALVAMVVIVVGIVTLGNEFVSADNMNKNYTVSVNLTCVITPKPGVSPCTRQ